jgi:hypothetical protein
MAPVARDMIALLALSTVGWFFPLPSLGFAAGNVVPSACHLVLVAAQAPLVALHEDAQNDSRLATIPREPGVVERASP